MRNARLIYDADSSPATRNLPRPASPLPSVCPPTTSGLRPGLVHARPGASRDRRSLSPAPRRRGCRPANSFLESPADYRYPRAELGKARPSRSRASRLSMCGLISPQYMGIAGTNRRGTRKYRRFVGIPKERPGENRPPRIRTTAPMTFRDKQSGRGSARLSSTEGSLIVVPFMLLSRCDAPFPLILSETARQIRAFCQHAPCVRD
jgi:hypothetical protein